VLHPLEMNTIPANRLGEFVCSLKDEGSIISDALDELFTRTWG
jgi:toxin CcdB